MYVGKTKKILSGVISLSIFFALLLFQNCSQVNFGATGPDSSMSMASTAPPANTYAWVSSGWGACSATCGGGSQTQTVTCQLNGTTVDNSNCTDPMPATSQICNIESCTSSHWVTSGFSSCSVSCGGGTQTQTAVCENAANTVTVSSQCPQPAPVTSQACNTQACASPPPPPVTYAWNAGTWGACSASCGGGAQARSVICQDSKGNTVANSNCTGAMPASTEACNSGACLPTCNYYDIYGYTDPTPFSANNMVNPSGNFMACTGLYGGEQPCTPGPYCYMAPCNVYCADTQDVMGNQGG
jgi:hypothetical protein